MHNLINSGHLDIAHPDLVYTWKNPKLLPIQYSSLFDITYIPVIWLLVKPITRIRMHLMYDILNQNSLAVKKC